MGWRHFSSTIFAKQSRNLRKSIGTGGNNSLTSLEGQEYGEFSRSGGQKEPRYVPVPSSQRHPILHSDGRKFLGETLICDSMIYEKYIFGHMNE